MKYDIYERQERKKQCFKMLTSMVLEWVKTIHLVHRSSEDFLSSTRRAFDVKKVFYLDGEGLKYKSNEIEHKSSSIDGLPSKKNFFFNLTLAHICL